MAKIVITSALFLVMVAMASAYTTITTTVVEEENTDTRHGDHEMCQQQFRKQQELRQCQMYLQQGQPYAEDSIEMVDNRQMHEDEELKRQCCRQLENMDEECRCQGIKQMVREKQQGRRQMGQMGQMAMELTSMCNIEPRQCQIRAIWF